jgi:DNA-directed RNA polymerase specialized sigma24 family protein
MSDVPHRAGNEIEQIASQARWVRELALAVARDAHSAEDASQDALLAALRRNSTPDNLTAWLRVAVRRLLAFRARSDTTRCRRGEARRCPSRPGIVLGALSRLAEGRGWIQRCSPTWFALATRSYLRCRGAHDSVRSPRRR